MSLFEQIKTFTTLTGDYPAPSQSDEERLRAAGERLLAAGYGVDETIGEAEPEEEARSDSEGAVSTHQSEVVDESPATIISALVERNLQKWSRAIELLTDKVLTLTTKLEDAELRAEESLKGALKAEERAVEAELKIVKLVRSLEISEAAAKASAKEIGALTSAARASKGPTSEREIAKIEGVDEAKQIAKDLYVNSEVAKTLLVDLEVKVQGLGETAIQLEERILELRGMAPTLEDKEEEIFSDDDEEGDGREKGKGLGSTLGDKAGGATRGEDDIIWDDVPTSLVTVPKAPAGSPEEVIWDEEEQAKPLAGVTKPQDSDDWIWD